MQMLVRLLWIPCSRYVDDFLGCSKAGLVFTGGKCMDVMLGLCGLAPDAKKSEDGKRLMLALGHWVHADVAKRTVLTRLDEEKAQRWSLALEDILEEDRCDAAIASKFAGRFSWTVTMQADKVGRAYIRGWYAAAHAPLPGGKLRVWHRFGCYWWLQYLHRRPVAEHMPWGMCRRHARIWADAAGETRWLAAVLWLDGVFYWTRWRCDDALWSQLLHRLDHNIGTQEMLAVILALYTWMDLLDGVVVTIYTDNEGVRYSLISGTSRLPEVALSAARFWQLATDRRWGILIRRVESKSNIADGPTRDNLKLVRKLVATWSVPALPEWAFDLWRYDGHAADLTVVRLMG